MARRSSPLLAVALCAGFISAASAEAACPEPCEPLPFPVFADFDYAPQSPHVGETVTFTSTSWSDAGISEEAWDLDGDGAYDDGVGTTVTKAFATGGTHMVGLLATARDGGSATHRVGVKVTPLGRVIFASNRGGNRDIYAMAPDGSGATRLTTDPNGDSFPAASPDGRRIVFTRSSTPTGGSWDIWGMRSDGTRQTRLTERGTAHAPSVSPDGTIAFSSWHDGAYQVWAMDADGANERPLTTLGGRAPAFSPDGQTIAFSSDRNRDGLGEVRVMNADGTGETALTAPNTADEWPFVGGDEPSFSPDGGKIVYSASVVGSDGRVRSKIAVMNADGSNKKQLANTGGVDPQFSPDGGRIAFEGFGGSSYEIWAMDADGSNEQNISANPAVDQEPAWLPPPVPDTVNPVAQAPVQRLGAGSTLGTDTTGASIPARVAWAAGSDNVTGGPDLRYQLAQRVNGGAWTSVTGWIGKLSVVRWLVPGSSYQFRVQAKDEAGNVSLAEMGPSFTVAVRQEDSFAYGAGWLARTAQDTAYGGFVKPTTTAGAIASSSFSGRNVAVVMPKRSELGTARFCLFEATTTVVCRTVDLSPASGLGPRRVAFAFDGLDRAKTYRIEVSDIAGRIELDGIVVFR